MVLCHYSFLGIWGEKLITSLSHMLLIGYIVVRGHFVKNCVVIYSTLEMRICFAKMSYSSMGRMEYLGED
jgi:hypothetical protein